MTGEDGPGPTRKKRVEFMTRGDDVRRPIAGSAGIARKSGANDRLRPKTQAPHPKERRAWRRSL